MSHPTTRSAQNGPPAESDGPRVGTRIDPAHPMRKAADAADGVSPAEIVTAEVVTSVEEQVAVQAREIAQHLRRRQRELDQRESQLNAHVGQLDDYWRTARMWLDEQRRTVEDRAQQLTEREGAIARRLAQIDETETQRAEFAARRHDLETEADRLERRSDALKQAARELDVERRQLARSREYALSQIESRRVAMQRQVRLQAAALDRRRASLENQARRAAQQRSTPNSDIVARRRALDELAARLDARDLLLTRAETALERARETDATRQGQLELDRQQLAEQTRLEREQLADRSRRLEAEFTRRRQWLVRRHEELQTRATSLDALRDELADRQRQALETRLATEQLWWQLAEHCPADAVCRAVGRIRAEIADYYRVEQANVANGLRRLELLRDELARRHDQLHQRKTQLDAWEAARREELDAHADQLRRQREELAAHACRSDDLARAAREEAREAHDEIRRLLARLRQLENEPPMTAAS